MTYIENGNKYEDSLKNWMVDLLKSRFEIEKENYRNLDDYLKERMYFVTFTFGKDNIVRKYQSSEDALSPGEVEFRQFNHVYNLVCRGLLGRKYNKEEDFKKPLSIVCMDANGSRYWAEMGNIENIHLHSIWLMDEYVKNVFDNVLERVSLNSKSFDINGVDIGRYTGDVSRLISYSFKFDKFSREDAAIASTFRIYPRPK